MKLRIGEDIIKQRLVQIIAGIDEHIISALEKKKEKIKSLQKLKPDDKNFMKNGLRFINGSLMEYFYISIKKMGKNTSTYYLENLMINNKTFILQEDDTTSPVLGKFMKDDEDVEEDEEDDEEDVFDCEDALEALNRLNE